MKKPFLWRPHQPSWKQSSGIIHGKRKGSYLPNCFAGSAKKTFLLMAKCTHYAVSLRFTPEFYNFWLKNSIQTLASAVFVTISNALHLSAIEKSAATSGLMVPAGARHGPSHKCTIFLMWVDHSLDIVTQIWFSSIIFFQRMSSITHYSLCQDRVYALSRLQTARPS